MENEDIVPEMDDAFEAIVPETEPARRGVRFVTVAVCSLLAALAGAAGGGALAYQFRPAPVDMSALQTEINALQQAQSKDAANLAQIKRNLSAPVPAEIDLSPLENRLAALEKAEDFTALNERLAQLENAAPPQIDAEALAQLQAAQKDGFEWPETDAIEAEIAALEARIDALEQRPVFEPSMAPKNTEDIDEIEPAPTQLLLPFPKSALLSAARAVENEGKSFLQRRLSKHVSVQEAGSPSAIIADIEAELAEDNYDAAGRLFDTLPSQIRSVGADWRAALETAK